MAAIEEDFARAWHEPVLIDEDGVRVAHGQITNDVVVLVDRLEDDRCSYIYDVGFVAI